MGFVVSLIILAVGVFMFFSTVDMVDKPVEESNSPFGNIATTGNQLFNMVGIIFIIGVMMMLIGLVYNFVGRDSFRETDYWSTNSVDLDTDDEEPTFVDIKSYEKLSDGVKKEKPKKTQTLKKVTSDDKYKC